MCFSKNSSQKCFRLHYVRAPSKLVNNSALLEGTEVKAIISRNYIHIE